MEQREASCTLTFWDPESVKTTVALSIGSGKGCSVWRWADGAGDRGVSPTHPKLGLKGCVSISLKSLRTGWKGTPKASVLLRCARSAQGQRKGV